MSEAEWAVCEPLLPALAWLAGRGGRPASRCMRDIVDAIRHLTHNGPVWRALPADFTAIEERCAALLVLHASLASKHLAVGRRRLADVATIFLPISFLAGFWGQNFDVLTGSIEKGWPAFLVLGVGLSVACVAVIVFMLSRRSWK